MLSSAIGLFAVAAIMNSAVFVQSDSPEIETPDPWIHAGEGTNVNISCIVKGKPVPSLLWKKADGQTIHNNDHYRVMSNGHHHTLEILNFKEEDFGRYECVASNSLSSTSENVHIIGTPQRPQFTSKPNGPMGTKYTISWTVDSYTPVDEYSLMYRKISEDWEFKTVPASDSSEGNVHTQMFRLLNLEPATSYEARVTARNKFGWSKTSDSFVFTTKTEADTILSKTGCLPQDSMCTTEKDGTVV